MGYDIPDKVKYKEKIIFNLDAMQLVYVCFFTGLALIAYRILPIPGDYKFVLPTILTLAGLGFAFLGLDEKFKAHYAYFQAVYQKSNDKYFPRRLIPISKIEANCLHLTDGKIRAILMVSPLNFSLLDKDRQKALIKNFREFLNHLESPIQIVVRTTTVRLEDYYSTYEEKNKGFTNPSLTELYQDFKEHEKKFLSKNDVKERGYYLVVCQDQNWLEKSKRQAKLEEHIAIIQEKLASCGLQSRRLSDDELNSFVQSYLFGGIGP